VSTVHEVDNGTRREFILGGVSLGALLAGCGGDEEAGPAERRTRTVQDAYGEVVIPTRPQRVIADTVSTMANVVALGTPAVGAAVPVDIRPDYVGPPARRIKNVVASDGWTIDVERALALRPDLIIATGAEYNEKYCRRYKRFVPTYCIPEAESSATFKDTVKVMANVLGRETQAAKLLTRYDDRVAALRARVAAAGLDAGSVGVLRFDAAGWFGIRIGQPGNQVLEALGLREPNWGKPNADDYIELSLERLALLNRAHTLLLCRDDNVVERKLEVLNSPLWKRLEPVREGRALRVGAWNGDDMLQMDTILDDIERTLVVPAESS